MSDARSNMLDRIRRNRSSAKASASSPFVESWLGNRVRGPRPTWEGVRLERFTSKLTQASASIAHVTSLEDIPRAMADYCQVKQIGKHLVSGATDRLKSLAWPEEWTVEHRAAGAADTLVLTEAYGAIAETGSLVLCSGPQTPTTSNFLTDHFVCVLPKNRIVDTIEDVWEAIRSEMTSIPRAINFVTGPSRTADVEQTIQLGAHGPRYVHVLLLDV